MVRANTGMGPPMATALQNEAFIIFISNILPGRTVEWIFNL
jgi:hypothetical protein